MVSLLFFECLGALILTVGYVVLYTGRRGRNLPPGPPTLPLIGNLHQVPKTGAHLKFAEWAKTYGRIFSLKMGSATAVVITDGALVKSLIDKKGAIYNQRPLSYVSYDLITKGDHVLVMQGGERWRLTRKTLHQILLESKCENEHIKLQNAEAAQMLRDICDAPEDLMLHPKRYSNSIIVSLLYGIRTSTVRSEHMKDLYEIMDKFSTVMEVGAMPPVDIFPIFKYLPEFLWSNWQTRAKKVNGAMEALYEKMAQHVIDRRTRSGNKGSMLDTVLDQREKFQLSPNAVRFFGGAAMEGGSDTSASMILVFITAMLKYPEIQKKAQAEIDSAVGEDRTPIWSDFNKIPYINMIIKECLRWRPVTPLAFPHANSEDDVVDGMHIPKGSTVIMNVWGMHMDPVRYPSPDTFNPENYRGMDLLAADYAVSNRSDKRDHYSYGAGRRICSGIHLAERGMWLAMAKLLWAFNFVEIEGKPVDVSAETGYTKGLLHCPVDFECDVQVRSAKKKDTIMREFEIAQKEIFVKYEEL